MSGQSLDPQASHGRFITLEGIDGAGKSTHVASVVEHLRARGREVVATREPGGTELGEMLRELVLHHPMHPETETLLMFAARREHIERVIRPALLRGAWVLSDRFTDATFAYQGGGRGVAEDKLLQLERWVQEDLQPDLTIIFDLDPETARKRFQAGRPDSDRFEREQEAFFQAVRNAYLRRARQFPRRIRVVDTGRPLAEVREDLARLLDSQA